MTVPGYASDFINNVVGYLTTYLTKESFKITVTVSFISVISNVLMFPFSVVFFQPNSSHV